MIKSDLKLSYRRSNKYSRDNYLISKVPPNYGFTIVELLVVIIVIGVLAAITIVSYTGITTRANIASLQSDLSNARQQLKLYQIDHGAYPDSIGTNGCPTPADAKYCLKPSGTNTFSDYVVDNSVSPQTFAIYSTNGPVSYRITNDTAPDSAWLTIGNQVWSKYNLNIGTKINGTTAQLNNSVLEKYCYNNLESNCTTGGAFYQWDEAMQYVTTEGSQGICPTGSHIPTDNDWKILEIQLGMTQAQADITGWRGTDQGTKLKTGGSSGLSMPLAGYRNTDGSFVNLSVYALLWSSSESSPSAWYRYLGTSTATVFRVASTKSYGFSVRCVGN